MNERPDEYSGRIEKVRELREMGIEPYPFKYDVTHAIFELLENFEKLADERVRIAGRLMSKRIFGKLIFGHIMDEGAKIQIAFRKGDTEIGDFDADESIKIIKKYIDIGDIIGVEGVPFVTKTGERTVLAKRVVLLSKCLLPLPEKWHGLKDKEIRYRRRYLDLIVNEKAREVALRRVRIISLIRRFLDERGFIEFETPILQPIYGGATARPFETYSNALDLKLYLRISDELYLKRLLVGGFNRVYEFSRDFRNEGIDRLHYPEFTILEAYAAYWDYKDMMELLEEMILYLSKNLGIGEEIQYRGETVKLKKPFRRISFLASLEEKLGFNPLEVEEERVRKKAEEAGLPGAKELPLYKVIDKLFDKLVAPDLLEPTFVLDHPLIMSPLAKKKRDNPLLVERFEFFVFGLEIANAFSELNDPIDQRRRFEEQIELRKRGDLEIPPEIDEDFLTALEYGMPPAGGIGVGVERLVMILVGEDSVRDVILFPQLRPKE